MTAPLTREEVIATLRAREAELRAHGVTRLFLFGSVARGEADEESDVDVMFEYESGNFSILDQAKIKAALEDAFGHGVDVVARNSIHPLIKERVEGEAVEVFS